MVGAPYFLGMESPASPHHSFDDYLGNPQESVISIEIPAIFLATI
jgi:hypothetical protein